MCYKEKEAELKLMDINVYNKGFGEREQRWMKSAMAKFALFYFEQAKFFDAADKLSPKTN